MAKIMAKMPPEPWRSGPNRPFLKHLEMMMADARPAAVAATKQPRPRPGLRRAQSGAQLAPLRANTNGAARPPPRPAVAGPGLVTTAQRAGAVEQVTEDRADQLDSALDVSSVLSSLGIEDESEVDPEPLVVDGITLPPELAQLRSLLELRAKHQLELRITRAQRQAAGCSAAPERAADGARAGPYPADDAPVPSRRELELLEAKASFVDVCLLDFPESLLFLHELLLDHEQLLTRLEGARRRATAFPAGYQRWDEGYDADDAELEDFDLDMAAPVAPTDDAASRDAGAPAGSDSDSDLEALDQRRLASLKKIRTCLKSCGQEVDKPHAVGRADTQPKGVGDGGLGMPHAEPLAAEGPGSAGAATSSRVRARLPRYARR